MSNEFTLEQKIERAEKLERVFRVIYSIFCIVTISFVVSALIFAQYFTVLFLLSVISGLLMMFFGRKHLEFNSQAHHLRMQSFNERYAKLHDSISRVFREV